MNHMGRSEAMDNSHEFQTEDSAVASRSSLSRARDVVAEKLDELNLGHWGEGLRRMDVERLESRMRDADARLREQIREHPARTLLIAAGAGFALGFMLRGRE
jgi:hypothetical protein